MREREVTDGSAGSGGSVQRHVVILCHPDGRSFNAAVARTYCDTVRSLGHEVIVRDLYRLNFDPVLKADERPGSSGTRSNDVAAELESIRGGDMFVLVYPIWFGTPPAMMKGYVERVLGAGFSHDDLRERRTHPLLTGRHLVNITTSGSTITWLDMRGAWRSLRDVFDSYLAKAFSMASNEHLHLESVIEDMDEVSVREKLKRVEDWAADACARLSGPALRVGIERAL